MLGSDMRPMVTTVAPTIPVLAASSMPTSTTDIANPPRRRPSSAAMLSSSSSATRDFSSTTPMSTNRGTATRVKLLTVPNRRPGSASRNAGSKAPAIVPRAANSSAVPASVNATG